MLAEVDAAIVASVAAVVVAAIVASVVAAVAAALVPLAEAGVAVAVACMQQRHKITVARISRMMFRCIPLSMSSTVVAFQSCPFDSSRRHVATNIRVCRCLSIAMNQVKLMKCSMSK